MDFTLLKLIVEYIYRGCVNIDHTELQKFLQTARALKISGLVNYGEEIETQPRKIPPPPKLTASRNQQKRTLTDSSMSSKGNKIPRKEHNDSEPVIRTRNEGMMDPPSAPNEIQAAYLSLEVEAEENGTHEENTGADTGEEEQEHDENIRTDDNIPFLAGMLRD